VIVSKRHRIALVVTVIVACVAWIGVREYRCKLRGDAFANLVARLKTDAAEQLKVGASKADLDRFFLDHKIPYKIQESQAFGTLRTEACAPLGCFKDTAFIGVRVSLDEAGTVTESPKVFGMYQDCF
jgi:hypothetical protein